MSAELHADLEAMLAGLELIAARAVGTDDCRDVVQEVATRALAAIAAGRVTSRASLPAFVHGIARHVIADVHRARARTVVGADIGIGLTAREPNALESLVTAEEMRAVERALRSLRPDDRELLRRCFLHGERIEDIAQSLAEPAHRLRKRKSRALARLRAALHDQRPTAHLSPTSTTTEP